MDASLPLDLRFAVAAINERFEACRLVSAQDVEAELPARPLSLPEIDALIASLAAHGFKLIEEEALRRLAGTMPDHPET